MSDWGQVSVVCVKSDKWCKSKQIKESVEREGPVQRRSRGEIHGTFLRARG